jgi:hypothetical protein
MTAFVAMLTASGLLWLNVKQNLEILVSDSKANTKSDGYVACYTIRKVYGWPFSIYGNEALPISRYVPQASISDLEHKMLKTGSQYELSIQIDLSEFKKREKEFFPSGFNALIFPPELSLELGLKELFYNLVIAIGVFLAIAFTCEYLVRRQDRKRQAKQEGGT